MYATVSNAPIYIDSTLYRLQCLSYDEAYFLAAVLNSDFIQKFVRATKGGARDIHTYFWWKIPIPRFDNTNSSHKKLSMLGNEATNYVNLLISKHKTITRKKIIGMLRDASLMPQIDAIVKDVLESGDITWR